MLLVERGLAASRERARALILAGQVRVDGLSRSPRPAPPSPPTPRSRSTVPIIPYVGRGGVKLAHALDVFGIDVERTARRSTSAPRPADSPTCCSSAARARVVALDVGHGQLDWKLRSDPRVDGHRARERAHADCRSTSTRRARLRPSSRSTSRSSRCVSILPVVPPLLDAGGDVVALVKPQFEAGRDEVGKGGIVRDDDVRQRVVDDVARPQLCARIGARRHGANRRFPAWKATARFLMHLRPASTGAHASDMGHIQRVGLIAKHHLDAAAGVLAELAGWLEARDVRAVFETETAALVGPSAWTPDGQPRRSAEILRPRRRPRRRRHLHRHGRPHRAIGDRRPDPRRQLRQPRLPDRDHARRAVRFARGGPRRPRASRDTDDAARPHAARGQTARRSVRSERRRHHEGRALADHRSLGGDRRSARDAGARRRIDRRDADRAPRPTTSPPAARSSIPKWTRCC